MERRRRRPRGGARAAARARAAPAAPVAAAPAAAPAARQARPSAPRCQPRRPPRRRARACGSRARGACAGGQPRAREAGYAGARGACCGARGGAAPAPEAPEAPAAEPAPTPPPPKKGPSDDARRLARTAFLVGLKSDATEDELRAAFEGCGAVAQTRVLKDKRSGQPTGKGFVEFVEDGDARAKALKLGKEQRKALGGSAPCKCFASATCARTGPRRQRQKSRGRRRALSCRAF